MLSKKSTQAALIIKTDPEHVRQSSLQKEEENQKFDKYINFKNHFILPSLQKKQPSQLNSQIKVHANTSRNKKNKRQETDINSFNKLSSDWENIQKESERIISFKKHKTYNYDPIFQSKLVSQSIQCLIQSLELIDNIIKTQTIESLALDEEWEHLSDALTILKSQEIKETFINLNIIKGKALKENGDIYSAIQTYQKSKQIAQNTGNLYIKMRLYKILGKVYLLTNSYRKAMNCFLKMLNLSWFYQNIAYELYAYDKLSMCFLYQGDLQTAVALHNRMSMGKVEQNSQTKQYALKRVATMKGKVDLKNEYIQDIHHQSDTSVEEECYIQEMARNDIKNSQSFLASSIEPEQKKFIAPTFKFLMHNSNNRRRINFQSLSNYDQINKKIGQNSGFKYFWTQKSYNKYKSRLIKLRLQLTLMINSFKKQMSKQEFDTKGIIKLKTPNKIRRNGLAVK